MTDTAGGKFALDGGDDTLVEVAALGLRDGNPPRHRDRSRQRRRYTDHRHVHDTVTDVVEGVGDVGSPIGLLLGTNEGIMTWLTT